MNKKRIKRLDLLALFCGGAGISVAPILVRLSDAGPSSTAFYRLLFALPLLWWAMSWPRNQPLPPQRKATLKDLPILALTGLLFVGDLGIWHWSLQYTTVANSTLLTNLAPIFVTLGAWLFFSEKITAIFTTGLVTAILGAFLLLGSEASLSPDHRWGDFLALVAAVFYAGYILMVKRLRKRFTGLTIVGWAGLVACPSFLLAGVLAGENLMPASLTGWSAVIALGLISHLGGQTLIAYALGHLPASFSSIVLLMQPVVAGVLAGFLFQEYLTPFQLVGALIVLAGIGIASRPTVKPAGPI